jgi:hypothetical protein
VQAIKATIKKRTTTILITIRFENTNGFFGREVAFQVENILTEGKTRSAV